MCLQMKKPVIMVVAVIGSTEESAVDPLEEIYNLRNEFRGKVQSSLHQFTCIHNFVLNISLPFLGFELLHSRRCCLGRVLAYHDPRTK